MRPITAAVLLGPLMMLAACGGASSTPDPTHSQISPAETASPISGADAVAAYGPCVNLSAMRRDLQKGARYFKFAYHSALSYNVAGASIGAKEAAHYYQAAAKEASAVPGLHKELQAASG